MLDTFWMPEYDKTLRHFESYLTILDRRPSTVQSYLRAGRDFLAFTRKKTHNLNSKDVFRYLLFLKEQKGLSGSSLNQKRSALAILFRDILAIPLPKKVLKFCKKPKRLPEILTEAQVARLLQATDNLKHRTILMTMYSAGLRISEAIHLRPNDIDSEMMQIHIRDGKGQKDRQVMLSETLLTHLRHYWKVYRPKDWIFPGARSGRPINAASVQKTFKRAALKAGIRKHVTPHSLRHSFATSLLQAGVGLPYIQQLMGHSSINTTMIYLRVCPKSAEITSPLDRLDL